MPNKSIKNKTMKRKTKIQNGKGLGKIIGSIASEALSSSMTPQTTSRGNTKDIIIASEIAAKELIRKICDSLNPPNSDVFLNIASNSFKTYLEGEDAQKMMNEQMKGYIENIMDKFLNENRDAFEIFKQNFKTHQEHIRNLVLLPAIMKEFGNGRQIKAEEISDLVNAIENNLLGRSSPSI